MGFLITPFYLAAPEMLVYPKIVNKAQAVPCRVPGFIPSLRLADKVQPCWSIRKFRWGRYPGRAGRSFSAHSRPASLPACEADALPSPGMDLATHQKPAAKDRPARTSPCCPSDRVSDSARRGFHPWLSPVGSGHGGLSS